MELTNLLTYQIGWYVFGTAAAFAAALLFWQKGRAVVTSPDTGSGFGIRLGGAAAIFVAVLLVIHYINPLKLVVDPNKLLLVYATPAQTGASETDGADRAGAVRYVLQSSPMIDADALGDGVAVRLIPMKYVHDLTRSANENAFTTAEPITPGVYELLLDNTQTGKLSKFLVEIPASGKESES